MATNDLSLKEEFDILLSALTTEKSQYPQISHEKIDRIQQAINKISILNKGKIETPPIFTNNILNHDNWIIANNYYEETIDSILYMTNEERFEEITKLEAWFITLISPPPKNRNSVMVDLWRKRELDKLDNNHTSNCPIDYQEYVKENIEKYLSKSWKSIFKIDFENANKSVAKFQYIKVVRLSETFN